MNKKKIGHAALRRGRFSEAGGLYFITLCEAQKNPTMGNAPFFKALTQVLQKAEEDGVLHCKCMVVMPDHIHFLINLGQKLTLGQCIGRIKSQTRKLLGWDLLNWESSYFDHKVRDTENILSIFLYIFLNPFRAKLIPLSESWPYYYCCNEDWKWFSEMLDDNSPPPKWLEK